MKVWGIGDFGPSCCMVLLNDRFLMESSLQMNFFEWLHLLLFKVDFEKAFDSVDWSFLLEIMRNSNSKWGLRQGDPLSFFLFLIVAEALQVSILEACDNKLYKGIYLANYGANLCLLQYADDALFFGEWSRDNALYLIHILSRPPPPTSSPTTSAPPSPPHIHRHHLHPIHHLHHLHLSPTGVDTTTRCLPPNDTHHTIIVVKQHQHHRHYLPPPTPPSSSAAMAALR
nr:putative RNA-directed DNA polymerase, eukaryota, reverse transcriptase zinc-binding domain protein [Tanacetum cinerariifolium]